MRCEIAECWSHVTVGTEIGCVRGWLGCIQKQRCWSHGTVGTHMGRVRGSLGCIQKQRCWSHVTVSTKIGACAVARLHTKAKVLVSRHCKHQDQLRARVARLHTKHQRACICLRVLVSLGALRKRRELVSCHCTHPYGRGWLGCIQKQKCSSHVTVGTHMRRVRG